ncbi:MAG: hypothetical protein QNJ60_06720 [Xenococcaceae cyanobacterium MO_188.B19]|nr:hypothetical protein [Xenococcaceae cyanobacterium MO_188.B19]
MKKILGICCLIVGCLFLALVSYNAVAVIHYDLDPVSVLAALLNISIQTLGYISAVLSLVFLILTIFFCYKD